MFWPGGDDRRCYAAVSAERRLRRLVGGQKTPLNPYAKEQGTFQGMLLMFTNHSDTLPAFFD